ncbi:MAG: galactosyltransferase-related protein [Pseudomonadota bacterium]
MSVLLSVVSHKQAGLVHQLLQDLHLYCPHKDLEVIITVNVKEPLLFKEDDFDFRVKIVQNKYPKGFGANHNAAFRSGPSDFFGVLNPDLRLTRDPFAPLSSLLSDKGIGVIAPLIIKRDCSIEDSARRLPTPARLIKRILRRARESRLDYEMNNLVYPDWVAGIFMLFSSSVFSKINGFDKRYYLYFEDVDLCSRLRLAGYRVVLDPSVSVIHEARRDSHNNIRYFMWHVISGLRFFSSRVFMDCLLSRSNKMVKPAL